MKPVKKAKGPLISKARAQETRLRLSLYDKADKAERAFYDAQAVAEAARKFWEQSQKALKAAAGVSARERAEAVFDAAKKFWEQSANAVSDAQLALDAARDELIDCNDRRAKQAGEQPAADYSFLSEWAESFKKLKKKKC